MRNIRVHSAAAIEAGSTELQLDQRAAHYLRHVLRVKIDDSLTVFDGLGGEYRARVLTLGKKHVDLELLEFFDNDRSSPLDIELGLAISKSDHMDYSIQKSTELGVSSIQPLLTERIERRFNAQQLEKRHGHWHAVIVSAAEQSGLNKLPVLKPAVTLPEWLNSNERPLKFVLDGRSKNRLSPDQLQARLALSVAIGPEGGFSEQELNTLVEGGFQSLFLGPRVLRTETAPIAILSILQFLAGDL